MSKFRKHHDRPGWTRTAEPDPILLAASVLALDRSSCAQLASVSSTGARLSGCGDVTTGDAVWIKVGILDSLATVIGRDGDLCEIVFDMPLDLEDLGHFRAEARNMLVMRISPEERLAAIEWIEGFAG